MPDYQLGKIYKIECNVTEKVYIGSTCEPTLARRLTKHVGSYRCYLNGKFNYISSFDVLQNRNYDIVLIESYPCNSKDELHARERYHTNNIDCVNKNKGQGMINELGEKQYNKQYYNDNKDKIIEKSKEYYKQNKEKSKEYYEKNKDIILAKKNEKHMCICGNCYTNASKLQHLKSKKHQQYLKYKTIIDGLNMIKALDKYFNAI